MKFKIKESLEEPVRTWLLITDTKDAVTVSYRKRTKDFSINTTNPNWVVGDCRLRFMSEEDANRFAQFFVEQGGAEECKVSPSKTLREVVKIKRASVYGTPCPEDIPLYVSVNYLTYKGITKDSLNESLESNLIDRFFKDSSWIDEIRDRLQYLNQKDLEIEYNEDPIVKLIIDNAHEHNTEDNDYEGIIRDFINFTDEFMFYINDEDKESFNELINENPFMETFFEIYNKEWPDWDKIKESLQDKVQYGVHQFSTESIIFRGTEEECIKYIDDRPELWDDAEVYWMTPEDPHYQKNESINEREDMKFKLVENRNYDDFITEIIARYSEEIKRNEFSDLLDVAMRNMTKDKDAFKRFCEELKNMNCDFKADPELTPEWLYDYYKYNIGGPGANWSSYAERIGELTNILISTIPFFASLKNSPEFKRREAEAIAYYKEKEEEENNRISSAVNLTLSKIKELEDTLPPYVHIDNKYDAKTLYDNAAKSGYHVFADRSLVDSIPLLGVDNSRLVDAQWSNSSKSYEYDKDDITRRAELRNYYAKQDAKISNSKISQEIAVRNASKRIPDYYIVEFTKKDGSTRFLNPEEKLTKEPIRAKRYNSREEAQAYINETSKAKNLPKYRFKIFNLKSFVDEITILNLDED